MKNIIVPFLSRLALVVIARKKAAYVAASGPV
jgi:hypothetical protein